MKIAIITDIHHGPQSHTKADGWDALQVVRDFIGHAGEQHADLILDMGDRISDTTRDADRQVAAEVAEVFTSFAGPRHHLLGNHDVANMTVADNEEIFAQSMQQFCCRSGRHAPDPLAARRKDRLRHRLPARIHATCPG